MSYQATTLARLPSSTFVNWPSTMELFGVLHHVAGDDRVHREAENALQLAFGSALESGVDLFAVVFFFRMATKSTTETFGVGTRIE